MRPKVRTVVDELAQFEGALTADFQRVYGLRLIDCVLSRTPQEVLDLISWLPSDSVYKTSKFNRTYEWGTDQELLLAQANLMRELIWVHAQSNSKKRIPRPEPISGPHEPSGPKKTGGGDATAFAQALMAQAKKG